MTKHKLDEEVEDILQHYGIKGMKWGVKRSDDKDSSSVDSAAGGGGIEDEDDENVSDEERDKLGDVLKSLNVKLGKMNDSMKEKGKALMAKLLGKGKPTYRVAKPDARRTQLLREAMKTSNRQSNPHIQKLKKKQEADWKKYGSSNSKVDKVLDGYKKQGYKKHESKNTRSLAERGYTFKTGDSAEKLLAKRKKEGYKKSKD